MMIMVVTATSNTAWAQFYSSSDGSDGPFVFAGTQDKDGDPAIMTFDLANAVTGTWDATPGGDVTGDGISDGVYDPQQWAVVFKYTTIDVPAGMTVKFTNHPSGAPVVWLASGDVDVHGMVDLNGAAGVAQNTIPVFAEPGPGGFAGGRNGRTSNNYQSSAGMGPGGGQRAVSGGGGGFGTAGSNGSLPCVGSLGSGGGQYGSTRIIPLIGGSGGSAAWSTGGSCGPAAGGCGAGGGAILVASSTEIHFSPGSQILARGGAGANYYGGGGSGGGIRLVSNLISGTAELRASKGIGSAFSTNTGGNGADGPISVEAFDLDELTITGSPAWNYATPRPVFVPPNAPALRVVRVNGMDVPSDPMAGVLTTDVEIDEAIESILDIEATNIPAGTAVTVFVIPANGTRFTIPAQVVPSLEDPDNDGVFTISATYLLPAGRMEIQLRATW
jgi:hypothetical protein